MAKFCFASAQSGFAIGGVGLRFGGPWLRHAEGSAQLRALREMWSTSSIGATLHELTGAGAAGIA